MLKIKDNVDLKELEKFGFKLNYRGQYETNSLVVFKKNRHISGTSGSGGRTQSVKFSADTLYDLIKADLVEKI